MFRTDKINVPGRIIAYKDFFPSDIFPSREEFFPCLREIQSMYMLCNCNASKMTHFHTVADNVSFVITIVKKYYSATVESEIAVGIFFGGQI